MNHSEIVSFLWGVADLIRDTFKRGKYQGPGTVKLPPESASAYVHTRFPGHAGPTEPTTGG